MYLWQSAQWPECQVDLAWQAALFPEGRSGIRKIRTGAYRDHAEPMQIVTPRMGKPDIVHYQAPGATAARISVHLPYFDAVTQVPAPHFLKATREFSF